MNSLITNNQNSNFYEHLISLLDTCESFILNVAFINYSGVQLLLDTLQRCEKKGIKGKVLSSTYLNFTDAKALEKLREFDNIEVKIFDDKNLNIGFHSKCYIFEFKDEYKILLGSSNITASAFKTNIEWNIKAIHKKDDIFINDILREFEKLWQNSFYVSDEFVKEYSNFQKKQKIEKFSFQKEISINFMQKKALENLEKLRLKGENKALVIAATGSGKTYLSAFDVKKVSPKRLLFLVHRENILIGAKNTFSSIIKDKTMGIFSGNKKQLDKDYIFSTIQTMSTNFEIFAKEEFDYIIVDEAHHIVSPSYKKILKYFKARFLLGLTATTNRSDGQNIYKVFDENIACDIRLNESLENNLVVPFHYFGIDDISVDYENIDLNNIDKVAKLLQVNRRVDFILEKLNFYAYSGQKRKVLAFCISKEHAKYMSEEFNKKGINSEFLTSDDNIERRENIIKNLEDDMHTLEVIFTVDIFNEGIDIPSVNTVLMLRPTNSPIVFAQQLGRGLRKYKDKEFLTILDFIGNHNKAFLVVLSLIGDKKIDKDSIKLSILNNFANIKNAFISMDKISKQRILSQIEDENFNSIKYLKEDYLQFKSFLKNKVPVMLDFFKYDELIEPIKFIKYSKSYIEFLVKVEKSKDLENILGDKNFIKAIRFVQSLLPIKRIYEFVILKYLLDNDSLDIKKTKEILGRYLDEVSEESIYHSFCFLNQDFFDSVQKNKYLKLVELKNEEIIKTNEFEKILENKDYKDIFLDSLSYGILQYEKSFSSKDYGLPFLKLYEKYNMQNIAQVCNFPKIHSSFRGSGFLKYKDDFFLFINLHKEKFSKSSKYQNTFLSKDTFTYSSKPSTSQNSTDGQKLCYNKKYNIKLHIFMRKFIQVDKQTQAFIYLGLANSIKYEGNKPINLHLKLQKKLDDELFKEFTKIAK